LPKTKSEGLAYAALKLVERRSKDGGPATVDGEAAIEEALSATGASGTASTRLEPSRIVALPSGETSRVTARCETWHPLAGCVLRVHWSNVQCCDHSFFH